MMFISLWRKKFETEKQSSFDRTFKLSLLILGHVASMNARFHFQIHFNSIFFSTKFLNQAGAKIK